MTKLARRIGKSSAQWEAAISSQTGAMDLTHHLFSEMLPKDKAISVFSTQSNEDLVDVALALSMIEGNGPKGCKFIIFEESSVKSKGITIQKSPSNTLLSDVDKRHRDILIQKSGHSIALSEIFLTGQIVEIPHSDVQQRALSFISDKQYNIQEIAAKRKDGTVGQGVCNSALTMTGQRLLDITPAH